jgi:dTDP-4-amino-4,6-dideoxygalactose transaminase
MGESMNSMAPIPLIDLKTQYARIGNEVDDALRRVVTSAAFVLGEDVAAFEREFAGYTGTTQCIGVASGTSALKLGMQALGIGPGDEVILPTNTYIACAFAVSHVGATVVLVDAGPDHLIDVPQIEAAITPRTKAIMAVHLYGQPADMAAILGIARARGLFVIEDASQSHGGTCAGAPLGSFGDVAAFSFYPGKNLGAYGDGGAVCTSDEAIADRVRLLRDLGQRRKHVHEIVGENCRLDTMQAAVLRVKLRHLDDWNELRRAAASRYDARLHDAGFPAKRSRSEHVFQYYVVCVNERDRVMAELSALGISTGINHPTPIHLQPAYADLGATEGRFPQAEWACNTVLSLPMFPEIEEQQIERVADALLRCAQPAVAHV